MIYDKQIQIKNNNYDEAKNWDTNIMIKQYYREKYEFSYHSLHTNKGTIYLEVRCII